MTTVEAAAPSTIRAVGGWARRRVATPVRNPLALGALALGWSLIAWLRMSPASRGAIWAEDGRNFLADAAHYGPLEALSIPYAGYMHLIPRAIAGAVSVLPVEWWAQGISAGACLVAGGLALVVYLVTNQLPIAPWARLLLASVTVLVPTLVAEVLGNAANMYTFALWTAVWVFFWRPTRWWSAVAGGALAVLLSGTAIQIVALVPLLAYSWTRRRVPIAVGVLVGLAVQLWGYTHSVRDSRPSWPALGAINDGYLHQVGVGSWIESAHAGAVLIVRFGWIAGALALVPFGLAGFVMWRSRVDRRDARVLAVVLLGGSYVYWFAFFALNDLAIDYSNQSPVGLVNGASPLRYAVFPSMLLWAVLVLAIGWRRPESELPGWWPRAQRIVVAVLLVVAAVNFVGLGTVYRSRGPEWTPELDRAQSECASAPGNREVAIPISPIGAPWTVKLACRTIVEDSP